MPKQVRGKTVTVTLSPYIWDILENLALKKGLKKSAVITIALEKYARGEVGNGDK